MYAPSKQNVRSFVPRARIPSTMIRDRKSFDRPAYSNCSLAGTTPFSLSVGKDLDGARKRRFALSGEHRPGYHFLRKITIPCEPGREDLSPRGCQKRLLLLASDDERRQETFRGSSRFPSQRRCLRRRLITGET